MITAPIYYQEEIYDNLKKVLNQEEPKFDRTNRGRRCMRRLAKRVRWLWCCWLEVARRWHWERGSVWFSISEWPPHFDLCRSIRQIHSIQSNPSRKMVQSTQSRGSGLVWFGLNEMLDVSLVAGVPSRAAHFCQITDCLQLINCLHASERIHNKGNAVVFSSAHISFIKSRAILHH